MLGRAFDYLTHNFGIVYLIGSVATLLFLLYLALSRYGDIRLGDTRPDFSTFQLVGDVILWRHWHQYFVLGYCGMGPLL